MREKVTASMIFKERKSSYPRRYNLVQWNCSLNKSWKYRNVLVLLSWWLKIKRDIVKLKPISFSVKDPFRGDYIGLRRNPLWKDVLTKSCLHKLDRFVVFADILNKINRSNGKVTRVSFEHPDFPCRH